MPTGTGTDTGALSPPFSTDPNGAGPLTTLEDTGTLLANFFKALTDWTMWRSLGWIITGAIFLVLGLAWMETSQSLTPAAGLRRAVGG